MFKKGELRITTALSAALLAAACGSKADPNKGWTASGNTAVCTDEQGRRVEDRNCAQNRGYVGGHHFGWYYMGRGGYIPGIGGYARGGSYSAAAGTHFTRAGAASISRGGFGSSAHASGARGG